MSRLSRAHGLFTAILLILGSVGCAGEDNPVGPGGGEEADELPGAVAYTDTPVRVDTDANGVARITAEHPEAAGEVEYRLRISDENGTPLPGAEVEYVELDGRRYIAIQGPGDSYVPTLLFADHALLRALADTVESTLPVANGSYAQPESIFIEAIVIGVALYFLTTNSVEFILNAFEVEQFYWQLGDDGSGCFTWLEFADYLKARSSATANATSIAITYAFAAVPIGQAAVPHYQAAGEALKLSADFLSAGRVHIAEKMANAAIDEYGLALDRSIDSQRVRVQFEFLDDGPDIRNLWAYYIVSPDPTCNDLQGQGSFSGRVFDAVTGAGLYHALVDYGNGDVGVTSPSGTFTSGPVEPGVYSLQFAADGYVPTSMLGIVLGPGEVLDLEPVPLVPAVSGVGSISGMITDATTGVGIAGAVVELRPGMNAESGPAAQSTESLAGGMYRFADVAPGTYTVRAIAESHTTAIRTGIAVGSTEVPNQDLSLSSALEGELRIVLTWGEQPYDLDSHLTGPDGLGGRFHVYFAARGSLDFSPFAWLDVDDTNSFGPETITVSSLLPGVYRYSVLDFTNRSSSASTQLAASGASVDLYDTSGLVRRFFVPAHEGTLWTVFEFDGSTLTVVNEMSYASSSSEVDVTGRSSPGIQAGSLSYVNPDLWRIAAAAALSKR